MIMRNVAMITLLLIVSTAGQDCPQMCTMDYKPVCGTDWVTYPNECGLRASACREGKTITVASEGECVCPQICTMDYRPLCGSDGVTYANKCQLDSTACQKKQAIAVAYEGECAPQCDKICTTDYTPVCGSDGKTYSNLCNLEAADCRSTTDITVAYQGECEDCNKACTFIYEPVCGSDGTTYSNKCQLENVACEQKRTITVSYEGECKICDIPMKIGPCRASKPRFYYKKDTGTCEQFFWGGCQENGNNFETKEACEAATKDLCQPIIVLAAFCNMPAETGRCRAYFERYFYNSETGKCEQFVYGGCDANENNFETIEECNQSAVQCRATPRTRSGLETSGAESVTSMVVSVMLASLLSVIRLL